jgi:hypothetical protein
MGVRAALESVMIDRVGDRGKFVANIEAFQKAGYLSERQRGTLDAVLDAGHAAIHRGLEPANEDVRTLVDIAEGLIEEVYLHGPRADVLDRSVPKRPPRK